MVIMIYKDGYNDIQGQFYISMNVENVCHTVINGLTFLCDVLVMISISFIKMSVKTIYTYIQSYFQTAIKIISCNIWIQNTASVESNMGITICTPTPLIQNSPTPLIRTSRDTGSISG